MVRASRVDVKRWLQWSAAAAGITSLFWVTGLLASGLTALEVLSSSVHGLSLADYRATPVLALAPLSPEILVEASRDNAARPSPSSSPGPTASHAPPNPDAATDTDSASDSHSELADAAAVAEPALVKKQVGGPARLAGDGKGREPSTYRHLNYGPPTHRTPQCLGWEAYRYLSQVGSFLLSMGQRLSARGSDVVLLTIDFQTLRLQVTEPPSVREARRVLPVPRLPAWNGRRASPGCSGRDRVRW